MGVKSEGVIAGAWDRVPELARYNALLHLVVLIWGFTGIFGRLISLDSVPLVFYRVSVAVPALVLYFLVRGVSLRVDRSGLLRLSGIGLLVAIHWTLFFLAIKLSNVSVGLVCQSVAPFVTALIEPIAFRRRVRPHELILGLAAAIGVGVIFRFETEYAAGIAVGLAAASIGALFVVMNGRLVERYDSQVISFYELLSAWVGLLCAVLLLTDPMGTIPLPKASDLAYLLLLGTVCTAFAFVSGTYVMRRLSPFTVILTTNLEPVYGIVLALIVFRESELMSAGFYAGATVILASIWVNAIIVRRMTGPRGAGLHGESAARGKDAG